MIIAVLRTLPDSQCVETGSDRYVTTLLRGTGQCHVFADVTSEFNVLGL